VGNFLWGRWAPERYMRQQPSVQIELLALGIADPALPAVRRVDPGAIALTRMPNGASSRAIDRVRFTTPALAAT
jgi:hypothetical protein